MVALILMMIVSIDRSKTLAVTTCLNASMHTTTTTASSATTNTTTTTTTTTTTATTTTSNTADTTFSVYSKIDTLS